MKCYVSRDKNSHANPGIKLWLTRPEGYHDSIASWWDGGDFLTSIPVPKAGECLEVDLDMDKLQPPGPQENSSQEDSSQEESLQPFRKITTHKCDAVNEKISLSCPDDGPIRNVYLVSVPSSVRLDGGYDHYRLKFVGGDWPTGLTNEVLLAIVLDRLEGFQKGDHPCEENDHAKDSVIDALIWLQRRHARREGLIRAEDQGDQGEEPQPQQGPRLLTGDEIRDRIRGISTETLLSVISERVREISTETLLSIISKRLTNRVEATQIAIRHVQYTESILASLANQYMEGILASLANDHKEGVDRRG